jgi:hypothetical protein
MNLNLNLPRIEDSENKKNEVEQVLISTRDQIESTYNGHLSLIITTSSTLNRNDEKVLNYALHLVFNRRGGFSYRLMEINCLKADGGLPVNVNGFIGPMEPFGEAGSIDELARKIEEVFAHPRTRNIILTNY